VTPTPQELASMFRAVLAVKLRLVSRDRFENP
jgi:hypothetical protein